MSFSAFDLHAQLLDGVAGRGFDSPTPLQEQAIPALLAGRDVLACAASGSGKTAAFLLPVLHRLLSGAEDGTRALVLAAGPEGVERITGELAGLTAGGGVTWASANAANGRAAAAVHLLVATPEELLSRQEAGELGLDGVEIVVLDDADRMLEGGMASALESLLDRLPSRRQTALFAATLAPELAALCDRLLHDPVRLAAGSDEPPAAGSPGVAVAAEANAEPPPAPPAESLEPAGTRAAAESAEAVLESTEAAVEAGEAGAPEGTDPLAVAREAAAEPGEGAEAEGAGAVSESTEAALKPGEAAGPEGAEAEAVAPAAVETPPDALAESPVASGEAQAEAPPAALEIPPDEAAESAVASGDAQGQAEAPPAAAGAPAPGDVEATVAGEAAFPVRDDLKAALLVELFARELVRRAIVFVRTKQGVNRVSDQLRRRGISTDRIHGKRSPRQRNEALAGFVSGRFRALVATDVAVDGLSEAEPFQVVNFDPPSSGDDYLQRVKLAEATVITLVSDQDEGRVRALERSLGGALPVQTLEGFDYDAPAEPGAAPADEADGRGQPRRARGRSRGRGRRSGDGAREGRGAASEGDVEGDEEARIRQKAERMQAAAVAARFGRPQPWTAGWEEFHARQQPQKRRPRRKSRGR